MKAPQVYPLLLMDLHAPNWALPLGQDPQAMTVASLPLWIGVGALGVGNTLSDPLPSHSNRKRVMSILGLAALILNHKYVCNLLNNLDFLAISEHWLHDFNLH